MKDATEAQARRPPKSQIKPRELHELRLYQPPKVKALFHSLPPLVAYMVYWYIDIFHKELEIMKDATEAFVSYISSGSASPQKSRHSSTVSLLL